MFALFTVLDLVEQLIMDRTDICVCEGFSLAVSYLQHMLQAALVRLPYACTPLELTLVRGRASSVPLPRPLFLLFGQSTPTAATGSFVLVLALRPSTGGNSMSSVPVTVSVATIWNSTNHMKRSRSMA